MSCSVPGFPVLHSLPELLKLMSTESVMPSNHLIPCCPLLLLPSIFPSIRVSFFFFQLVSSLHQVVKVFSNMTVQKHSPLEVQEWSSTPLVATLFTVE